GGGEGRERETEREREVGEAASHSSLTPGSKFIGSQADFLGLDAALMTGLGAGDAGPTGDLQVLLDEPGPDSLPATWPVVFVNCFLWRSELFPSPAASPLLLEHGEPLQAASAAVTGIPCPVKPILQQQSSKVDLITETPPFLSPPIMHLLTPLLLLLLLRSAELRRGPRSGAVERGSRGHVRGRGRAGVMRRQTQECKEYMEAGEKYLDCQDRQLTTVMQDWPKDIHHLLLARNKIQVLRDNMFSQFTQLKSLDLQQNDISMVEDGAFSGLSQLTTLLLQHNGLKTATEEVLLPMPRLTYLRLYDNPWSCHCPLDSLVRTLQVPSNRNLGNYGKCAEPQSLRGQKLRKLNVDSLCADHKPVGGGEGGKPPPNKEKPEAPSMCHTYMFPKPLLDCSNK
ncbi:hypothetical protein FQN60_005654, partial [Etheostoma spectabile]